METIVATEEKEVKKEEFLSPETNPLADIDDKLLVFLEQGAVRNANETEDPVAKLCMQIVVHACWKEARSRQRVRENNKYAGSNKREVKSYGA